MMKIIFVLLLSSTAAMAGDPVVIRPVWKWSNPPVLPPPFETPSWVPDEATKQRALRRAYELNSNSIDLSDDPIVTGRTVITPETEFNMLDATVKKPKPNSGK